MATARIDLTDAKYQWVFEIVQSELATLINEVVANPNMSYSEKVQFFAAALSDTLDSYVSDETQDANGLSFITSGTSVQVVAVFAVNEFTAEKYPDGIVPLADIMAFMGIPASDIPSWAK